MQIAKNQMHVLKAYVLGNAVVGFHRGYCNNYSSGFLQQHENFLPIKNKKIYNDFSTSSKNTSELISEKICYGIISSFYYLNPCFHIPIICHSIRRMEKRIRNIPFNEYDWSW